MLKDQIIRLIDTEVEIITGLDVKLQDAGYVTGEHRNYINGFMKGLLTAWGNELTIEDQAEIRRHTKKLMK